MSNSTSSIIGLVQAIAKKAVEPGKSSTVQPPVTSFGATVPFQASQLREAEPALGAQIECLEATRNQLRAELDIRNQEGFDTVASVIANETETNPQVIQEALLELTRGLKEARVTEIKDIVVLEVKDKLGRIKPADQDPALLKRFIEVVLTGNDKLQSKVLNEAYPDIANPESKAFKSFVNEVVHLLQPGEPKAAKKST